MAGIHVPITTGNGVYFKPGTVGAGPDDASANAYLENRITNQRLPLWIYDFTSDFSATGVEAQSRMKKEFYARFFTQPRYLIKGQAANQYEYQRIAKFVRQGMLAQLSSSPTVKGNSFFEAFLLRIEGRASPIHNRNTKGGHMGWSLEGYIEEVTTGGTRFQFSPEYEMTFVLANATEGPMKLLDAAHIPSLVNNIRESFLKGFNKRITPSKKDPILEAYGE